MKIASTFIRAQKRALVFCTLLALCLQPLSFIAVAQNGVSKDAQLTNDKRLLHVLNRVTFGARPGDLERVRAVGVERFIEAQLNPDKIDDTDLQARLERFPTLQMTNTELLARYRNPGQVLREMQRTGDVPPELAALVAGRPNNNKRNDSMPQTGLMNNEKSNAQAMSATPENQMTPPPDRRDYRQTMAAYYRENNLDFPQRITQELQSARILRAAYSNRQLQEVMVDFWTNHFNVFANKGADKWYLTQFDRDAIRPNALSNFRGLLEATAKSPAMLFYLDNFQSVSPDAGNRRPRGIRNNNRLGNNNRRRAARGGRMRDENMMSPRQDLMRAGSAPDARDVKQANQPQANQPQATQPPRAKRGINENYARELLELHTLGVEGGYTQQDIVEVARAFTGWTIYAPRGRENGQSKRLARFADRDLKAGEFYFNPRTHDTNEKTVLGVKISANGGIEDGQKVLDILANHPSTAKFIAAKLARKFISDTPQPETIKVIADAFTNSKGDIKQTLRAVFSSREFNSESNFRAKIKTPFELAISSIRALGVETDARPQLHNQIARMGEALYGYQAPTGYPDTAEHWVNTGALLERLNFAVALSNNSIQGTRYDAAKLVGSTSLRLDSGKRKALTLELMNKLLGGFVTEETTRRLMKQVDAPLDESKSRTHESADKAKIDNVLMTSENAARENSNDALQPDERNARRNVGRNRQALLAMNNFSPEEREVRRIISLVIGLPEFQRQ